MHDRKMFPVGLRIFSLTIVALFLFTPNLSAQTYPNVVVLSSHEYCQYPSVAAADGGNTLLAVWIEEHGGYKFIYYKVYTNGTWSAKKLFSGPSWPEYPHVVADSNGDFHMVWMEGSGGGRDIAYARFSNGNWNTWTGSAGDFVEITPDQRDVWPRLAIDPANDTLHAVWSKHRTTSVNYDAEIFHAQKAPGGGWIVERVSYDNYRRLNYHSDITARNNQVVTIWEQHTVGIYSSQRNTNGTWTTPVQVKSGGWKWPSVANDGNGNIHGLYGYSDVRYARRTNTGSWSEIGPISTYARFKNHVDIRTDLANNVYAVFQQGPEGPSDGTVTFLAGRLILRRGDTNGRMDTPEVLWTRDRGFVHSPVVAPDNNGGVHIVWYDAGVGFPEDKWLDWGPIYYTKAVGAAVRLVKVLSPNGGEVWRIGQEHTLTWEVTVPAGETPPETVIVEYSLDGGSTWNMLYDAVPNLGYATAEIPRDVVQPSTQCRFRITDPDSGVFDISDQDFTLLPPYAESGGSFVNDGIWEDGATAGVEGWHVGDFNGDGKDDLLNILINYNKVFVSDGTRFIKLGRWLKSVSGLYGWFPGDYNGDGMTDLMRFIPANDWGPDRTQVFLSTGESFVKNYVWSYADPGSDGFTVGDFNGDGRDDKLVFDPVSKESRVYLSSGSEFLTPSVWFTGHNGKDGWYTGDFNGDGMTDLARVHLEEGTAVLLSTGSSFAYAGNWTAAISNSIGWIVGDVNGDGKDDLTRYVPGMSTADVFLAVDGAFAYDGSWSDISVADCDWRMGDFNGDDLDDLLNFDPSMRITRVYLSTAASGPAGTSGANRFLNHQSGDLNRGINPERPALSPEAEADLIKPWLEKLRSGEEGNFFFAIKAEYEKQLGRKVRDVVIYRMLYRFRSPIAPR